MMNESKQNISIEIEDKAAVCPLGEVVGNKMIDEGIGGIMSTNIARRFVEKLRQGRNFQKYLLGLVVCVFVGMNYSHVRADMTITPGSTLPEFEIEMPNLPAITAYLGVDSESPFSLSQIPAKLIVVEFFNTYCHKCYQNAPIANQLYTSIKEDKQLDQNIKMIGIGLASKPEEIAEYRQKFNVQFPLFSDPQKNVRIESKVKHVPLTIVVDKSGKVIMSHLGVIKNVDAFFTKIKERHMGF